MRNSKEGIIATIGLIASCIAIFAFTTGWQSIWDIFNGESPPKQPTAIYDKPPSTKVAPQPTATEGIQSTSTPVYVEPQLVESGENYRIEYICNGQTGAELIIDAPDFPYENLSYWLINPVVKDIAGDWQVEYLSGVSYGFSFSEKGIASESLPSGNWMIDQQFSEIFPVHIEGKWGNTIVGDQYGKNFGFIFPTRDECTTKITLGAGKLEVGILDTNGTNALVGMGVQVFCQTRDIANNIIADELCPMSVVGGPLSQSTDATGLATFYLGPGRYFIQVSKYSSEDKFIYDIDISSGEEKRVIINYP